MRHRNNARIFGILVLVSILTVFRVSLLAPSVGDKERDTSSRALTSPSETTTPFRMLLGIFTMESDVQRRQLIRDTYLSYYDQQGDNNSSKICTLHDLEMGTVDNPNDCQLIYTFVVGGATIPNAPTERVDATDSSSMTVDRSLLSNTESDVVYLNIRENMNDGKTLTWFKYASSHINKNVTIDLIAKVDTDTLVYPHKLLSELERTFRRKRPTYGGVVVKDRNHDFMQGGFYFLSPDVVDFITSEKCPRSYFVEHEMRAWSRRFEDLEVGHFVDSCYPPIVTPEQQTPVLQRINLKRHAWLHHADLKDDAIFRNTWQNYMAGKEARHVMQRLRTESGGAAACPPEHVLIRTISEISKPQTRKAFLKMATRC